MTPAVRCIELVKRYPGRPPVEAVRGLDLTVDVGECFGLLGPNGAGKTTTIEIIEGIAEPTSGAVEGQRIAGQVHGLTGEQQLVERETGQVVGAVDGRAVVKHIAPPWCE